MSTLKAEKHRVDLLHCLPTGSGGGEWAGHFTN